YKCLRRFGQSRRWRRLGYYFECGRHDASLGYAGESAKRARQCADRYRATIALQRTAQRFDYRRDHALPGWNESDSHEDYREWESDCLADSARTPSAFHRIPRYRGGRSRYGREYPGAAGAVLIHHRNGGQLGNPLRSVLLARESGHGSASFGKRQCCVQRPSESPYAQRHLVPAVRLGLWLYCRLSVAVRRWSDRDFHAVCAPQSEFV